MGTFWNSPKIVSTVAYSFNDVFGELGYYKGKSEQIFKLICIMNYCRGSWYEYGKMDSFCKSLKIKKTIAYAFNNVLLNWSITKKVWKAFWAYPGLLRQFLECVILECFVNFLDDPYYESLLWFMILL